MPRADNERRAQIHRAVAARGSAGRCTSDACDAKGVELPWRLACFTDWGLKAEGAINSPIVETGPCT